MMQPIQITVKDIPSSEAIEKQILLKADKLDQFFEKIISCHVLVEQPQKHHRKGKLYNVHIWVTVPNRQFVATRNQQENLWLAIRDAFQDIIKSLSYNDDIIHYKIKSHPPELHGQVARLFDGFGFIKGQDGEEYYFNEFNVIKPRFEKLKVGMPVHFIEGLGFESLQARRVRVRKHYHSAA